jgi:hypothetical protein
MYVVIHILLVALILIINVRQLDLKHPVDPVLIIQFPGLFRHFGSTSEMLIVQMSDYNDKAAMDALWTVDFGKALDHVVLCCFANRQGEKWRVRILTDGCGTACY